MRLIHRRSYERGACADSNHLCYDVDSFDFPHTHRLEMQVELYDANSRQTHCQFSRMLPLNIDNFRSYLLDLICEAPME